MLAVDMYHRFWSKVSKTQSCWVWTASKNADGYGSFAISRVTHRAHRVAWILTNGEIPDGLQVLHRCDNPSCVNPDHLFLGTVRDNSRDMITKGRQWYQKDPVRARRARIRNLPRYCGEANPAAKLTREAAEEIRRLHGQGGQTKAGLARQFGVSESCVRFILKGETWKTS